MGTCNSGEITSKVDHISPASWRGDIGVVTINFQTCWLLDHQRAIVIIPEAATVFKCHDSMPDINILLPLGGLLVNQCDLDEEYDCSEICADYPVIGSDPSEPNTHLSTLPIPMPYTYEGDMEDTMADKLPQNVVTAEIVINGQKTTKTRALWHRMMYQTSQSSTDWLKCVQEAPCYNPIPSDESSSIVSCNSQLGALSLHIRNLITILIKCEEQIFLAISKINQHHRIISRR
jgi:hypothetical protein